MNLMLKISKDSTGKAVSVRGTPAEMMLFYVLWETSIWPDWALSDKLENKGDAAGNQHRRVVASINKGHDLLLSNNTQNFKDALDFAIERSRMLNIEVALD